MGHPCASKELQAVLADVNPEAQADFLGEEYVVSGIPLSWNSANVKQFLGMWAAKPVGRPARVGFTNTWSVRAEQPPPASALRNPDPLGLNVLALFSKKEYRPKQNKVVLKMKKGTGSKEALDHGWTQ